MVNIIFNDTYTLAIVKGARTEKSARAKVHAKLSEHEDYSHGWELVFLVHNKDEGTFSYQLNNVYRELIEALIATTERARRAARREKS